MGKIISLNDIKCDKLKLFDKFIKLPFSNYQAYDKALENRHKDKTRNKSVCFDLQSSFKIIWNNIYFKQLCYPLHLNLYNIIDFALQQNKYAIK